MRIFGLNRRIIRALLGSQYAHMLEYRAEIALWAQPTCFCQMETGF